MHKNWLNVFHAMSMREKRFYAEKSSVGLHTNLPRLHLTNSNVMHKDMFSSVKTGFSVKCLSVA